MKDFGKRVYDESLAMLKTFSPSKSDLEIRTLRVAFHPEVAVAFVQLVTMQLSKARDFELCMTWMSRFLDIHGDAVTGANEDLITELHAWDGVVQQKSTRLMELTTACNGITEFIRRA